MQYKYNLSGAVTSETYPSGRVVSDSYDAVNRVTQVWGAFNGQTASYVASLSYAAQGGPLKMAYGNQVVQTTNYNPQLQVSGLWDAVGDNPNNFLFLENPIGWGGTDNNGTLRSLTLYEGGPAPSTNLAQFTQNFTYDAVNRLKTAADSGGWSRTYSYDAFGNRTVSAQGLAANEAPSAFTLTNQISGGSYDAAGHQLATGGNGLAYDGEGRLSQISEPASWGGAQLTYYYDGEGRRVEKLVNGAAASIYVYDALGQMITEDSPQGSVGTAPCQTCFLSVDHLGSTRLVTDANGRLMALHDYLPFGDEVPPDTRVGRDGRWGPGNDNITQKFTGKERGETNLDYFGARYYAGALGRFTSPDPANAGADPMNPQSWNAYAYVLNNPLVNVDPSGMDSITSLSACGASLGQCVNENPGLYSTYVTQQMHTGSAANIALGGIDPFRFLDSGGSSTSGTQNSATLFSGSTQQQIPFPLHLFDSSFLSASGLYADSDQGNASSLATTGTQQQTSPTSERFDRLKNCALAYYGIDPVSVMGLSEAGKWGLIAAGAGGIPKSFAKVLGVRVIMQPGSSKYTSIFSILSLASGGGTLRTIANFGGKWVGPIGIASAVIDATAIGFCTASE